MLANEVIADLPVANGTNAGAVRLMSELGRVLAPGGAAVLTEFGGDFDPAPVRLFGGSARASTSNGRSTSGSFRAAAAQSGLIAEELPLTR